MLKKQFRLSSFRLISPRTLSTPFFTIKFADNKLDFNRFAFVVSKKTESRSTGRNLIKRRLRAVIEGMFENIKPGTDFIVYPKNSVSKAKMEDLDQEVKGALGKAKLIK